MCPVLRLLALALKPIVVVARLAATHCIDVHVTVVPSQCSQASVPRRWSVRIRHALRVRLVVFLLFGGVRILVDIFCQLWNAGGRLRQRAVAASLDDGFVRIPQVIRDSDVGARGLRKLGCACCAACAIGRNIHDVCRWPLDTRWLLKDWWLRDGRRLLYGRQLVSRQRRRGELFVRGASLHFRVVFGLFVRLCTLGRRLRGVPHAAAVHAGKDQLCGNHRSNRTGIVLFASAVPGDPFRARLRVLCFPSGVTKLHLIRRSLGITPFVPFLFFCLFCILVCLLLLHTTLPVGIPLFCAILPVSLLFLHAVFAVTRVARVGSATAAASASAAAAATTVLARDPAAPFLVSAAALLAHTALSLPGAGLKAAAALPLRVAPFAGTAFFAGAAFLAGAGLPTRALLPAAAALANNGGLLAGTMLSRGRALLTGAALLPRTGLLAQAALPS
mmetsp:Transcript_61131/g.171000  ORF Transcript_61131/g.171000 Transcript_61131/m.171000 type:complete len:446 (-) Transcript_61131:482-1819(-)